MSAVGINCASCHVAELTSTTSGAPQRILGATSHFDVEAFFGAVLAATFKTSDPVNMRKFLAVYLDADPKPFAATWLAQEEKIVAAIKDDSLGAKNVAPGELHEIANADVRPTFDSQTDLASRAHAMLQLFHNMRAALHVPDEPPSKPPPASGPGRNDAFGLLSAALLNSPQPYAPIKFGLVWNIDQRTWVHWDGNTRSPIARNLLASLGLGAPLHGRRADLQFALVKRQTDLTENILRRACKDRGRLTNARKISVAARNFSIRQISVTATKAVTSSIRRRQEIPTPVTITGRNCRRRKRAT